MPDYQDNSFNAPSLTFYLASVDSTGRYGVCPQVSNPEDILSFEWGEKSVGHVLVHDLRSDIGKFVLSDTVHFVLLGEAENDWGSIYVYKVITHA